MRSSMRSDADAGRPLCECCTRVPECHPNEDCDKPVTSTLQVGTATYTRIRVCDECAQTYLECTGWEPVP